MKLLPKLTLCAILLSGCAEQFLDNAERIETLDNIAEGRIHQDIDTLAKAEDRAARLAFSYIQAAHKVANVQDISTTVTILSAAATAYGSATGAGARSLADRAIPGVVASFTAGQYAPRSTMEHIYTAALRMNCVSEAAGRAAALGYNSEEPSGFERAAVVATRRTLTHVQIVVHNSVARSNVDFDVARKGFLDALGAINVSGRTSSGADQSKFNAYIQMLKACVVITIKPQEPDQGNSGRTNPDDPTEG